MKTNFQKSFLKSWKFRLPTKVCYDPSGAALRSRRLLWSFQEDKKSREAEILKGRPYTFMQNSAEYIKKCRGRKRLRLLRAKNPQDGNSQRNASSAHPCALIYMPACICKRAWICTCGARWAGRSAFGRLLEGKERWDLARTPNRGGSEMQSE